MDQKIAKKLAKNCNWNGQFQFFVFSGPGPIIIAKIGNSFQIQSEFSSHVCCWILLTCRWKLLFTSSLAFQTSMPIWSAFHSNRFHFCFSWPFTKVGLLSFQSFSRPFWFSIPNLPNLPILSPASCVDRGPRGPRWHGTGTCRGYLPPLVKTDVTLPIGEFLPQLLFDQTFQTIVRVWLLKFLAYSKTQTFQTPFLILPSKCCVAPGRSTALCG